MEGCGFVCRLACCAICFLIAGYAFVPGDPSALDPGVSVKEGLLPYMDPDCQHLARARVVVLDTVKRRFGVSEDRDGGVLRVRACLLLRDKFSDSGQG